MYSDGGGDRIMLRSDEYPEHLNPFTGEEDENIEVHEVDKKCFKENENSDESIGNYETKNPFYKDIQQELLELDDYDVDNNPFYHDIVREIANTPQFSGNVENESQNSPLESSIIISNEISSSNIRNITNSENSTVAVSTKAKSINSYVTPVPHRPAPAPPSTAVSFHHYEVKSKINGIESKGISAKSSQLPKVPHRPAPAPPSTAVSLHHYEVKSKINGIESKGISAKSSQLPKVYKNLRSAPSVPVSPREVIRNERPSFILETSSNNTYGKLRRAPDVPITPRRIFRPAPPVPVIQRRILRPTPPVTTSSKKENENLTTVQFSSKQKVSHNSILIRS